MKYAVVKRGTDFKLWCGEADSPAHACSLSRVGDNIDIRKVISATPDQWTHVIYLLPKGTNDFVEKDSAPIAWVYAIQKD